MASRQLKASAASFTPVTPSPWPLAAGLSPPQPIMFPFAAANVAVPGLAPGSLEQVATGRKGHYQAAPHWQIPADSTGMTVILDGSDEFAVKEGYYPAGLYIPGPVYLAQSVTYKRLAGPPVSAALMMPPFCQRVPAPTAGRHDRRSLPPEARLQADAARAPLLLPLRPRLCAACRAEQGC